MVKAFTEPDAALRFLQSDSSVNIVMCSGTDLPQDFCRRMALCAPNAVLISISVPGSRLSTAPLYFRVFGGFEVFCGKRALHFPNRKAKELLALCVHRQGGYVSMEEACDLLWPHKPYDERVKRLYRKAVSCLHHILHSCSDTVIFENSRGHCHVIPDTFLCDYYIYLSNPSALPPQDYLPQYEWAEEVRAQLYFAAHPEDEA